MIKSKRRKGLFTLLLSMILMIACIIPVAADEKKPNPFKDVKESDWFYNGVLYVYEHNLMAGISDESFDPRGEVTRAMAVTVIYNYEGKPAAEKSSFKDVPDGKWYSKAVGWAAANKVVSGYTDGTFKPNDKLSREQLATVLYNYSVYKKFDTTKSADLSKYKDASSIAKWALKPMAWANANKIINGTSDTELAPKGNANRAQMASVFRGYREEFGTGEDPTPTPVPTETPTPTPTPTQAPTPTPTPTPTQRFNYTATKECVPEAWKDYNHGAETENAFWIEVPLNMTELPEELFKSNTAITSVTIPKSVERLGTGVFQECTNLTEVNFPEDTKLTAISDYAFAKTGLTSVTIPKEIESIGKTSFAGCASLETVRFEENSRLKELGMGAFSYSGVTSVTIPASVTTLGQMSFANTPLTSIIFAEGSELEIMGQQALANTNITMLTIPKSVNSLGYCMVNGCDSLTTVTFESGTEIEAIGRMAFQGCGITSIAIPASVKSIDESAFIGCSALQTVTFADGIQIETIGDSAFKGTGLTSIEIPASVKSIGNKAFQNCSELATLTFAEDSLLETIGDYAFCCAGLANDIDIPKFVTGIGDYAFDGLAKMTRGEDDILFEPKDPPVLGIKPFGEYDDPNGYRLGISFYAYQRADVWEKYVDGKRTLMYA